MNVPVFRSLAPLSAISSRGQKLSIGSITRSLSFAGRVPAFASSIAEAIRRSFTDGRRQAIQYNSGQYGTLATRRSSQQPDLEHPAPIDLPNDLTKDHLSHDLIRAAFDRLRSRMPTSHIRQRGHAGDTGGTTPKFNSAVRGEPNREQYTHEGATDGRLPGAHSRDSDRLFVAVAHPDTGTASSPSTNKGLRSNLARGAPPVRHISGSRPIWSSSMVFPQVVAGDRGGARPLNGYENVPVPADKSNSKSIVPSETSQGSQKHAMASVGEDGQSFVGDLYLDGGILGTWITRYIEKVITRPSSGPTGIDVRSITAWPGSPLPN
jgi:hypothetical protein